MKRFYVQLTGTLALRERSDSETEIRNLPLSPASRRLLACLALRGFENTVHRDELAEMLWPECAPGKSKSRLSSAIFRLRRILGCGGAGPAGPVYIREEGGGVGLAGDDNFRIDFWELNRRVEAIRGRPIEELENAEMAALERELQDCSGPLLSEFDLSCFDPERYQYDENQEYALETLMRYFRATGRRDQSIAAAKKLVAIDPLREDVHATLIALYGEKGLRRHVVAQFTQCKKLLLSDLGLTPNAQVIATYQDSLRRSAPAASPAKYAGNVESLVDEINLSMELLQLQIKNLHSFIGK